MKEMCSSCTELLKSKECFGEDYFVMAFEACIFFSLHANKALLVLCCPHLPLSWLGVCLV